MKKGRIFGIVVLCTAILAIVISVTAMVTVNMVMQKLEHTGGQAQEKVQAESQEASVEQKEDQTVVAADQNEKDKTAEELSVEQPQKSEAAENPSVEQKDVSDIAKEQLGGASGQAKKIADAPVKAKLDETNSWGGDGAYHLAYNISVENQAEQTVTDWKLAVFVSDDFEVEQFWNFEQELEDGVLTIIPADFARTIAPESTAGDIGMIAVQSEEEPVTDYQLTVMYEDGTTEVYSGVCGDAAGTADTEKKEQSEQEQTAMNDKKNEKETPKKNVAVNTKPVGKLHVDGANLVDEDGNPVQLKGVSTHGLAWFPDFDNEDAFRTLKDDWGASVVRLAMYTAEYGGYCSGGDQKALKKLMEDGVAYATELGLYVIIDWHILSDGNPTEHQAEAEAFFAEMAEKYSDYTNVIYEICNEPQNSPWSTVIKPYAEDVIKVIRQYDEDAVILVGTNTWSQDIHEAAKDLIDDENVMYTLHFYAGTHKEDLRKRLQKACDDGVPVFVSECSITDASGNGRVDYESAEKWMEVLNANNISYIAWSLSNKDESSALIKPSCKKLSDWSESELSETGKWFRKQILGEENE